MISPDFWSGKRVLLTGHTGFKGAWLTQWLGRLGATVYGFSLAPDTQPNLFELLSPLPNLVSRIGDIRNPEAVNAAIAEASPHVCIHFAAQSLVRRSYRLPVDTFQTNVIGTAHVLDALRGQQDLAAILVITTDKVYENAESGHAFCESDPLGGHDPYSASKAAAELVTASWAQSYFDAAGIPLATARAGNVIGGGDWCEDRLIPDLWRAVRSGAPVTLRNPKATRPWQHVLEPLNGYLEYVEALAGRQSADIPRALNFGPNSSDVLTVEAATEMALAGFGEGLNWVLAEGAQPREMQLLALNAERAKRTIGWRPKLTAAEAIAWSVEWYKAIDSGADAKIFTNEQIERYEAI